MIEKSRFFLVIAVVSFVHILFFRNSIRIREIKTDKAPIVVRVVSNNPLESSKSDEKTKKIHSQKKEKEASKKKSKKRIEVKAAKTALNVFEPEPGQGITPSFEAFDSHSDGNDKFFISYPTKARRMRLEGKVNVSVNRFDDNFLEVDLLKSSGFSVLDDAVIDALTQEKFKNFLINRNIDSAKVQVEFRIGHAGKAFVHQVAEKK